ncbi:MAG: hypothetical protein ACI9VS_001890 [Candidatus Binatia bacterium]|jgi:hypothetical protein
MPKWTCVLEQDSQRQRVDGSETALRDAIAAGADLRVGTGFLHNEHIDITSDCNELIREVMDFRVTYLLANRWVAGIETLRMPIALPDGFGPRASMSFFIYNQDGHQAIARPHLDGQHSPGKPGPSPINEHAGMPKYRELENWDADTNAPSSNFVYEFEYFRYFVRDAWEEVLSHDAEGRINSGSLDDLVNAFSEGREIKVAIGNLCNDLTSPEETQYEHEVFVHVGAGYYYTERKQFMASANPVVRTRPSIPLGYGASCWDFGWLMPRSDGRLARWLCNPYTLKFEKSTAKHSMRWFVSR